MKKGRRKVGSMEGRKDKQKEAREEGKKGFGSKLDAVYIISYPHKPMLTYLNGHKQKNSCNR